MRNYALSILIFMFTITCHVAKAVEIHVKDSAISTNRKSAVMESAKTSFCDMAWAQIGNKRHYTDFSFTDIAVTGPGSIMGRATLAQTGNKTLGWGVSVKSLLHLGKNESVYGSASYDNSHTKGITWNENADFLMIFPYVTGDSMGGFMQNESYAFSGGYVRDFSRFSLGAEASYRAVSGFRDKDPRPRNIVSDFSIAVGGAFLMTSNYRINADVKLQSYTQNSSISFLADKGSIPVYNMTGLGADYTRFAGTYTASRYNATKWVATLGTMPANSIYGLSAVAKYCHYGMTKILPGASNLPLLKIDENAFALQTVYMFNTRRNNAAGIKLDMTATDRQGIENVVGQSTGNSFEIMGETAGYRFKHVNATLTLLIENAPADASGWNWFAEPCIAYSETRTSHASLQRHMNFSNFVGTLSLQGRREFGKMSLTLRLTGSYAGNTASSISLNDLNQEKSIYSTLLHNYDYLSDSHWNTQMKIRIGYALNHIGSLYLSFNGSYSSYKICGKAYAGTISTGILF